MEIEVIYDKGGLCAYKNDELLFYSTSSATNMNLFQRTIKVFNHDDNLVLELKMIDLIFKNNYKILFQNNDLIDHITKIDYGDIYFDENKSLKKRYNNRIISLNWNYYYMYEHIKIAQVKHNLKYYPCKMVVNIEDQNLGFLNQILIHVLSMRTADPNDD